MSRTNSINSSTGGRKASSPGARKRNGGLSVDDNKGLLFLGIILILIGLAGIKL